MSLPTGCKGNSLESLTLVENNGLISNDLEALEHFSQELHFSSDMDTTGSDVDITEAQEVQSEEVVQSDIGAHEVEIEMARSHSPEEILPDVKARTNVPPLRPLTIAPKPTKGPVSFKSGGQQLFLLQGGTAGQPIKILSTQGQEINVANLQLAKPITLRPSKNVSASPVSVLQPKQVIMKKVSQPQKIIADSKNIVISDTVKPSHGNIVLSNNTKTITLSQAQSIGLLAGAKFVPQVQHKPAYVVNKFQNKTIKIVPQTKTHTKILPAPQVSVGNKNPQPRFILKQANANSSIMSSSQIIQVAGNQSLLAGQLHQINIPGKGVQYIKLVTPSNTSSNIENSISTSSVSTSISTKQAIQVSAAEAKVFTTVATTAPAKPTNVILTEGVTTTIAPKPVKTTALPRTNTLHIPTSGQLVVLPAAYIPHATANAKVAIPAKPSAPKPTPQVNDSSNIVTDINLESNGMRPRKPCNCTKSQCLKLYCDCFANGEFCYLCNCMNCFNNLENEEHRQRAIRSCLERNPNAFRPKIGKAKDTGDAPIRKHTKGCNCKRSGCLKNYCECYEAKIACSSNCKCVGCRNIEDSMDKKGIISPVSINLPNPISPPLASKLLGARNILQFRPRRHSNNKQASSFITDDVIEATSQCLLTISDTAESNDQDEEKTKLQIIEEFGRCLKEIIECSMRSTGNVSI